MADVTLALYILVTFYMALTIRTNSTITFIKSFSVSLFSFQTIL